MPRGSTGYYYKSAVADEQQHRRHLYQCLRHHHEEAPHYTFAVNYDKRHFAIRDCQAPQDFRIQCRSGFPENLNADGSATIKWGSEDILAAMPTRKQDGAGVRRRLRMTAVPAMGPFIMTPTAPSLSRNKLQIRKFGWLWRSSTVNNNHWYHWEAGFDKYYRYPYEMRFENAVPMGFNTDYEGSKTNGLPTLMEEAG